MARQAGAAISALRPGIGARAARAWHQTQRLTKRNPTMAGGIVVVVLVTIIAIIAPLISPADPKAIEPANRLIAPGGTYWFGTDHLGRDIYSRTIYGGRVSLLVGFSVAAAAVVGGILFGLFTGYYRRVDTVVMRVMDGIMAIPAILLAIAMVATLGASMQNVIVALAIVEVPRATRVVRASVLSLREQVFVEAARAVGVQPLRILLIHILPNTLAPLMVQATYTCAAAIITEAYLSFLGAGTPPDIPSWGNIMAEGRQYIQRAIWMIFFPGLFLAVTVLGVNLAGDGLRDILDPKLARRG